MTDEDRQTLNLSILSKEYQISCPASEAELLQKSAQDLNKRMLDIKTSGGIVGLERIAVMAALNTTYDLLTEQKQHEKHNVTVNQYVDRLKQRLDEALGDDAQLELPTD